MWLLVCLTALANPKKDLKAGLKARAAKDFETALMLLDRAIAGPLKEKQETEARWARIRTIVKHPDDSVRLRHLGRAHEDFAQLGALDPDAPWDLRLRDEVATIVELTGKARALAVRSEPQYCAEVVPHHDRHSQPAVLSAALGCAAEIGDASAARALERDLFASVTAKGLTEPSLLFPAIETAALSLDDAPDPKLQRLDAVETALSAMSSRIEADRSSLGDAADRRIAEIERLRTRILQERLAILDGVEDSEARQRPILEAFVERDPANHSVRVKLGQVLLALGESEAGLAELETAMGLDPSDHLAPYIAGTWWVNQTTPLQEQQAPLKRWEKEYKALEAEIVEKMSTGRDLLFRALQADPDHEPTRESLTVVCERIRDRACLKKLAGK
jgi:tetratricopeptide (TPR) repeat protein